MMLLYTRSVALRHSAHDELGYTHILDADLLLQHTGPMQVEHQS